MTTLDRPIATGETFPALTLTTPQGAELTYEPTSNASDSEASVLVYFMRTPTCPVCHSHVAHLARVIAAKPELAARLFIIAPGDGADAGLVAARHAALADRIGASLTAHESVGLFVKAGLQQSGTFIVGGQGKVLWSKTATVPLGSFDARAVGDHWDL